MSEIESLQQRVITLESNLTYLQYDLEQINQVVLEQQRQIELLQQKLERFEESRSGNQPDLPHPFEDLPPHY